MSFVDINLENSFRIARTPKTNQQERLKNVHAVDLRLDKKWYFNKWSLNAYIDVENLYNFKIQLPSEVGIDSEIGDEIYTSCQTCGYFTNSSLLVPPN